MNKIFSQKHSFDYTADTQRVFHAMLEALSNPGEPRSIAEPASRFAGNGPWLAAAATLLDNEVTYFWNGDADCGAEIGYLTGSVPAPARDADFLLLPEKTDPSAFLPLVKAGTHEAPHTSATLIIGSDGEPAASCELSGPGVPPGGRRLALSEYEREWLLSRGALGLEYPLGVELIFLRNGGDITAVTRKVEVKWLT
ncbi:MAG: phosphonate C-P lyase system protein PhnH [Oscillospiraceae bacterium]|nr:phosphonate C-P lyase system protein PhnH [Oscillospiraceae bacterium]